MMLTSRQKRRIRQIVQDRHLAIVVMLCGVNAVSSEDLERLQAKGMIKLPVKALNVVAASHLLGGVLSDATHAQAQNLEPVQFWKMVNARTDVPRIEGESVEVGCDSLAEYIRSLGSRLEHAFITAIISKCDTLRRRGLLRGSIRRTAERRAVKDLSASVAQIAKDTKDDWMRLIHDQVQHSVAEGKALAMLKTGYGFDAKGAVVDMKSFVGSTDWTLLHYKGDHA